MTNNFEFEPNLAAKTIRIAREFSAPVANVWRAHTEADLLVKWIAPKPWAAEARTMDFTVGGVWLYAMVAPDGRKQWVYAQFTAIETGRSFSSTGMYCDAEGNPVTEGPRSYRETTFTAIEGDRTRVDMLITFEEEATIKMFAEGGFEQGTTAAFAQLDELLVME